MSRQAMLDRNPCPCTTCVVGRALRSLEAGIDVWLDEDFERQMSLGYLVAEVTRAVLDPKMGAATRRSLVAAVECVTKSCTPSGVEVEEA